MTHHSKEEILVIVRLNLVYVISKFSRRIETTRVMWIKLVFGFKTDNNNSRDE